MGLELGILPKGQSVDLGIESKQTGPQTFYFGAGWDNPEGPVDLDIVAVATVDGQIEKKEDLVYFNNRGGSPGLMLSEDNTTGEGEGDDESLVVNTSLIPANINKIVVGLVAYSNTDFAKAPNPHFRVCDGAEENCLQIADVPAGSGESADTALIAFELTRNSGGWDLSNVGEFVKVGNGSGAIQGFADAVTKKAVAA